MSLGIAPQFGLDETERSFRGDVKEIDRACTDGELASKRDQVCVGRLDAVDLEHFRMGEEELLEPGFGEVVRFRGERLEGRCPGSLWTRQGRGTVIEAPREGGPGPIGDAACGDRGTSRMASSREIGSGRVSWRTNIGPP